MAERPISIVMAIPDHPWTKATPDAAAVRIAMTVCEAGAKEGTMRDVVREQGLDIDAPVVEFREVRGTINPDLTVGVNVTTAVPLRANEGVCSPGVKLHGAGFIVTPQQAKKLGLGTRAGLDQHIRDYRNGRDLTSRPRGVMVIDLLGLSVYEVRRKFPEVYQHLLVTVRPAREAVLAKSRTKDAEAYAREWWLLGKPRQELRPALAGLPRYIATVETAKHRVFQFLEASILPDNMLVAIGTDDAFALGVLSSSTHVVWALAQGGTLEDRPRYTKSKCFDPFPFPAADSAQRQRIADIVEELDAHRTRVLTEHPHLTLTGLYNVLKKLRAGADPAALTGEDRRIFDDGLVLIMKELHDQLDAAVAGAYGWPANLTENDILARLVALNRQRAMEEANGTVRWLHPDYQIPRFGTQQHRAELRLGAARPTRSNETKPAFPSDDAAQTAAVRAVLASATVPLGADSLAMRFRQGRGVAPKINSVLAALQRTGAVSSNDAGRSFKLRRAA
jgi:hypothetical protein